MPAMLVFDLIIVGLILLTIGLSISLRVLASDSAPPIARVLFISGMTVAGLYCLIELNFVYLGLDLPAGSATALAMDGVRLNLRWITLCLSSLLVATSFCFVAYQRLRSGNDVSRSVALAGFGDPPTERSAARLSSMLEQSTDGIYCFEFRPPIPVNLPVSEQIAKSFDAVLVECNLTFAKSIGAASREEAIGTRFGDMTSIMTPESHEIFHRRFIENGYQLVDYDFRFRDQHGQNGILMVSAVGDIVDGRLVRLWGTDKNVLEQSRISQRLVDRLESQEFVARISSRLLLVETRNVQETLVGCLKDIANHMSADRMTIAWIDRESRTIDPLYFWAVSGEAPWSNLSLDQFPLLGSKILRGDPVVVNSLDELATESSVDAEHLTRTGVRSVCGVPMVVGGTIHGFCALGVMEEEREWTDDDLVDLRTLADLIANVVYRINARQALDVALAELQVLKERLEAENVYLRQEISLNNGFDEVIGGSDSLKYCLQQVQQVACTDTAVLVQGETGTGKELIVRAIHSIGDRSERPLVKVNCAALPAELIESELFGHEKGAFTGAVSRKRGRFDLADGGTLFLDEVGDFPFELQGKLLRVLQDGAFQRVGGTDTLKVDVRLIAATNRKLEIAVDSGQFRADLYYRISVFPINLPPLRERDGDIQLLAEHFVHKHAPRLGKEIAAIAASMMDQLLAYSWPGNVRELESVIRRALISAQGPVLKLSEALGTGGFVENNAPFSVGSPPVDLLGAEKAHIVRVLDQAGWVVGGGTGAAVKLGVPPSTLRSKMKKLGISRPS